MSKNKNPLSHVVNTILKPAFQLQGFTAINTRVFTRLEGNIIQYISVYKSGRSSYFSVAFSSLPVCVPFIDYHLSYSRHLQRNGRDGKWSSKHIDVAESAVLKVLDEYRDNKFEDWFEKTKAIDGVIEHLNSYMNHNFHSPHLELSVCYTLKGDKEKAIEIIENALSLESYNPIKVANLELLLRAINTGQESNLLDNWLEMNKKTLKLNKLK